MNSNNLPQEHYHHQTNTSTTAYLDDRSINSNNMNNVSSFSSTTTTTTSARSTIEMNDHIHDGVGTTFIHNNDSIGNMNEICNNKPVVSGEIDDSCNATCANEFSCVQVLDQSRTNVVAGSQNFLNPNKKKLNKFIVESTLGGHNNMTMRLNVSATDVTPIASDSISSGNTNENNNTMNGNSIYVSDVATTVLMDNSTINSCTNNNNDNNNSGQGSLMIPVNQVSGVSIVSCYRAVPVQIVNNNNNNNPTNLINHNPKENDDEKIIKYDDLEIDSKNQNAKENNKIGKNSEEIQINAKKNISIIENVNQILSDPNQESDNNNKNKDSKNHTLKMEQRIYITAEAQIERNNLNVIETATLNPLSANATPQTQDQVEALMSSTREQRRRERRERRAARNRMAHLHAGNMPLHITANAISSSNARPQSFEIVPDLLHSHLPPPYTTLPLQPAAIITPVPVPVGAVDNCRYSFPLPIIRR